MAEESARENSHAHTHEHEYEHIHGHTHTHTQTKAVLNRMSRLIGHMEATKKMIAEGRDCSEVLIQLSAVKSALSNVGKIILKDHLEHCIVEAAINDDQDAIARLNKAIDQFIK